MFGLATNFNSLSGNTKDTQLHCQFGTGKYLLKLSVEILTEFLVQPSVLDSRRDFSLNQEVLGF